MRTGYARAGGPANVQVYVKPYVKRGKTNVANAEAICEAVTQEAALLDHEAWDFLIHQRTQVVNAVRAHLGKFRIVVVKGIYNVARSLAAAGDVPKAAQLAVNLLGDQLGNLEARIGIVIAHIAGAQKRRALAHRLATVPGIDVIDAFALTTVHARRLRLPHGARLRGVTQVSTACSFKR